jgi:hypothetical protein
MALYCVPPESDITPGLSSRGKSAQDVFGECILRKNTAKEVLHTEEELRQFLTRAAGDAVAHIDYVQTKPEEQAAWLTNMPTDEEAGWGAESSNAGYPQGS